MRARSFSHVGITVRNFTQFVRFYWDIFGSSRRQSGLSRKRHHAPEGSGADAGVEVPSPGVEGVALFLVVGVAVVNLHHAGTTLLLVHDSIDDGAGQTRRGHPRRDGAAKIMPPVVARQQSGAS